jgi:hypothetical protein
LLEAIRSDWSAFMTRCLKRRGFPIHLPHDTAIAAIHRGRTVALPVRSFDAVPDFVVDEDNLEHAGLEFAVA